MKFAYTVTDAPNPEWQWWDISMEWDSTNPFYTCHGCVSDVYWNVVIPGRIGNHRLKEGDKVYVKAGIFCASHPYDVAFYRGKLPFDPGIPSAEGVMVAESQSIEITIGKEEPQEKKCWRITSTGRIRYKRHCVECGVYPCEDYPYNSREEAEEALGEQQPPEEEVCNYDGYCDCEAGEMYPNCGDCVYCNCDGICDEGESKLNCPDCERSPCNNNGVCETHLGENISNCFDCQKDVLILLVLLGVGGYVAHYLSLIHI